MTKRNPFHDLTQLIAKHITPRYEQLESNEQRMVLLAAIILPLIIMIFGVMLPLQDKQYALQHALQQTANKAAEAKQLASHLKQFGSALESNKNTENLLTTVERLARQSKVRRFISRIKPQSSPTAQQQLMLRLKNVPYTAALRFIHALAQQGLGLKTMKLQSTKTTGIVNLYAIINAT